MNRIIVLILSLVFLISCSHERVENALASPVGAEIVIIEDDIGVYLTLDEALVLKLMNLSGMEETGMLKSLLESDNVFHLSTSDYQRRGKYIDILMSQDSSSDRLSMIKRNRKVLEKSQFISIVDSLSSGYDSVVLKDSKNLECTREYNLEPILYNTSSWEETKRFFSNWIDNTFDLLRRKK